MLIAGVGWAEASASDCSKLWWLPAKHVLTYRATVTEC